MVSVVQVLRIFVKYFPKRQRKLEASIAEIAGKEKLKNRVTLLCETSWVEKHTTFGDLLQLYELVLNCFESIEKNVDPWNWFDAKSVTETSSFLKQMQSPAFAIHFYVCYNSYGFTKGLSKQFQGPAFEIVKAYEMVS